MRDLTVRFRTRAGTITPVDDISFDLAEGETLAVLGETGSGKSVTAQALMGLVPSPAGRITGGEIRYAGADLLTQPAAERRQLQRHRSGDGVPGSAQLAQPGVPGGHADR